MITNDDPKGLSKRNWYTLYLLKISSTKEGNLLQVYLCRKHACTVLEYLDVLEYG